MSSTRTAFALFLIAVLHGACPAPGDARPRPPEPAAAGQQDPTTPVNSSPPQKPAGSGIDAPEESGSRAIPEDKSVKLSIEPLLVGNLIDRVMEPATITVHAPGALRVEVYLLPVDSPYGGKPTGKARLIGQDLTPANGFKIKWAKPTSDPYVKIFAVVHKKSAPESTIRSHTIDVGLGGQLLIPRSAP